MLMQGVPKLLGLLDELFEVPIPFCVQRVPRVKELTKRVARNLRYCLLCHLDSVVGILDILAEHFHISLDLRVYGL